MGRVVVAVDAVLDHNRVFQRQFVTRNGLLARQAEGGPGRILLSLVGGNLSLGPAAGLMSILSDHRAELEDRCDPGEDLRCSDADFPCVFHTNSVSSKETADFVENSVRDIVSVVIVKGFDHRLGVSKHLLDRGPVWLVAEHFC